MKKAIFLDRDGVLNRPKIIKKKSFAPKRYKDFKIFSYSEKSVKKLKSLGFYVFVITNQPDVGKKELSKKTLKKMHDTLIKKTKVDKIFTCTHLKDKFCNCRKPNPGLILKAAKKFSIDLNKSYVVGDRSSDILAGRKANCRTIFIDRNYAEKKPLIQEATLANLKQATEYITKQESTKNEKN